MVGVRDRSQELALAAGMESGARLEACEEKEGTAHGLSLEKMKCQQPSCHSKAT